MTLAAGTRLGPYEVLAPIGAGGMGEVYRAKDTRLERTVALKVLPAQLSGDAERRERFVREARAVSSLNHPHICTLHDVGQEGGTDYLVMELIEGESLAERLTRGPLPADEALRRAIEIADALSKAHRQGIVHRDLKPANVMLTKQGAKLLDFGLARMDALSAPSALSTLPTEQKPLTQAGTLLGTFQYMAPEQLEGREADARSDIFAFGSVLYEMVTGRRAFEGKSQASLIASIMAAAPPPIASLQPMTPPALERVVRTCLAKDPDERWQTAHDLTAELRWIAEGGSQIGTPAPVAARRRSRERTAWLAAGAFALAAAAAVGWLLLRRERPREPVRFTLTSPDGVALSWPRLSPDGRTIAFVGTDKDGRKSIWLRPLGSFEAQRMDGTEGVLRPFWSPDSRYLGFFANDQLKKVAVTGGPPQLVCEQRGGADGSWSSTGVILFDGRGTDPIWRVNEGGGVPAVALKADASRKEAGVGWPQFLPDGRHFLYVANGDAGPVSLNVGTLDEEATSVLMPVESRVEYAAGHMVYVSQRTLLARPFSPRKRAFTGDPFPVTDKIDLQNLGLVNFSLSHAGDLTYINEARGDVSRLVWVDRAGNVVAPVGEAAAFRDLSLSPDETRVAAGVQATGPQTRSGSDIWVYDLKRGNGSRITFDAPTQFPVFSPDGRYVAYAGVKGGKDFWIGRKLASGAGEEEVLHRETSGAIVFPTDWSPDGRGLMLTTLASASAPADLLTLPADKPGEPAGLLRAESYAESRARFSPDGRWFAYQSNESKRSEVYVQAYPPSGGKWQISTSGGLMPMWRGDGKEIFYKTLDDTFYAVPVSAKGESLEVGLPARLFQRSLQHAGPNRDRWQVSRDGQRFLLNTFLEEGPPPTVKVVLDWAAGLSKQ